MTFINIPHTSHLLLISTSAFLYQFCILKAFFLLYMAPYPHTPFIYSEIILLFQNKITVFFKFSVFITLFTVDEHMPSYCYIKKFFLNNLFFHRIVTDHDCPDICTCFRDHQHTDHRNDIRPQYNRDIECKA